MPRNLTLVDTEAMDESVLSGNIVRVVENLPATTNCASSTAASATCSASPIWKPRPIRWRRRRSSPRSPQALHGIKGDRRIKLTILKELNQTSLGDIAAIYADVNRHLEGMNVVPQRCVGGGASRRESSAATARPRRQTPRGSTADGAARST